MTNWLKALLVGLTLVATPFALSACRHGGAEKAGEDVGEAIDEAADDVRDGVEEAGDKIEDATDK